MRSLERMRREAQAIFSAGVAAADPDSAVRRHIKLERERLSVGSAEYDLKLFDRVLVVGAGKASARMADALESVLGERISEGIVNVKYDHAVPLKRIRVIEAGHPLPDQAGLDGAERIVELLKSATAKDFVFCVISGGGSALLPSPNPTLTLADKQNTTQALLDSGAAIQEINAVRKHISQVKGGRLARLAFPATLVGLILSDVIGDPLDSIASGPTVADSSTFADCVAILERYQLQDRVPRPVMRLLAAGVRAEIEETPKADNPVFDRVQNLIVGSNRQALAAARSKALELGYNCLLLSSRIEGDTREAAGFHAAIAKELAATGHPVAPPACVISGGETTVKIIGKGKGGRNQEFVLAAAEGIDGVEGVVILSGGTDGTDGPTDAAGAVADGSTAARARAAGMEPRHYLANNDSYRFFERLDDLLITGPTFTNVMDLRVVLAASRDGAASRLSEDRAE